MNEILKTPTTAREWRRLNRPPACDLEKGAKLKNEANAMSQTLGVPIIFEDNGMGSVEFIFGDTPPESEITLFQIKPHNSTENGYTKKLSTGKMDDKRIRHDQNIRTLRNTFYRGVFYDSAGNARPKK